MTLSNHYIVSLSCFLLVCSLSGCSNAKQDYEEVMKLQQATELAFQQTTDYDIKLNSCENMVRVLQDYLSKHKEGEWSDVAKTALQSWQSRKTALENERDTLVNKLSSMLSDRAQEEARRKHGFSKIERVDRVSRDRRTEGNQILITDVFDVRMKGVFLGITISKLRITVSGYIATDTKAVAISKAVVEE